MACQVGEHLRPPCACRCSFGRSSAVDTRAGARGHDALRNQTHLQRLPVRFRKRRRRSSSPPAARERRLSGLSATRTQRPSGAQTAPKRRPSGASERRLSGPQVTRRWRPSSARATPDLNKAHAQRLYSYAQQGRDEDEQLRLRTAEEKVAFQLLKQAMRKLNPDLTAGQLSTEAMAMWGQLTDKVRGSYLSKARKIAYGPTDMFIGGGMRNP